MEKTKKSLPQRYPTSRRALLAFLVLCLFLLSACGQALPSSPVITETATPLPPTPTAQPPKTLIVCLATEPENLYLYGDSSRSKWSVLEALYDGPIDTINYEASPVLIEQIPSEGNGGVMLQAAAVSEGDPVADVTGNVVALKKGVRVFPAGCTSAECAVTWDGEATLELSQMVVQFKLLTGVTWSDGEPLTAKDSVFSYTISADPQTKVSKTNLDRTQTYKALDDTTVEWVGLPGYLTLNPAAFFWIPLPQHQLKNLTAEQLTTDPLTTQVPLGWGAYKIDEWVKGDHIRLVKNPEYYRAAEGLPYFDVLVYRFIPTTPEADLSMVITGECDIMDPGTGLESQMVTIRKLEEQGKVKSYFGMGPEWEGLTMGVRPASYDDVYNPYEDRQDYFGNVRVRQAIAYCVDREKIQEYITLNQSDIPSSYLPPNHPYAATISSTYAYNPVLGNQLLEEAGWLDTDGDPATPRVAVDVENVFSDTELRLNYYATESDLHTQVRKVIVDSLAECGIGVTTNYLAVDDMYASGPQGVIFGRNFDLAELAWSTGRMPPCFLFTSAEIPSERNKWLGTQYGGVNITGWTNEDYDLACEQALSAGLNEELLRSTNQRMQEILMEEVPVLPLFFHVKAMVSRPDLCGLNLDVTSRSALKNIESLTLGSGCAAD